MLLLPINVDLDFLVFWSKNVWQHLGNRPSGGGVGGWIFQPLVIGPVLGGQWAPTSVSLVTEEDFSSIFLVLAISVQTFNIFCPWELDSNVEGWNSSLRINGWKNIMENLVISQTISKKNCQNLVRIYNLWKRQQKPSGYILRNHAFNYQKV